MRKERRLSPSPTYSTTWVVAIRRTPRPPPGRPPVLLLPKNSHHPPTSAAAAWKRAERWKELWKVKKDEEKMGKPEWKRKRWMQKKRPLTLSLYGQLPWKEGEFFFSFSKCHFFLFHFDSFVWAQPLSSQQPRDHVTTSTVRTRGIDLQLDQLKIWNVERSWINKEYNWATYTHATGLPLSSIWNLLCQWGALWSAKAWIRTSREDITGSDEKRKRGETCAPRSLIRHTEIMGGPYDRDMRHEDTGFACIMGGVATPSSVKRRFSTASSLCVPTHLNHQLSLAQGAKHFCLLRDRGIPARSCWTRARRARSRSWVWHHFRSVGLVNGRLEAWTEPSWKNGWVGWRAPFPCQSLHRPGETLVPPTSFSAGEAPTPVAVSLTTLFVLFTSSIS